MAEAYVELKSTENQTVLVKPSAVGAVEVVPASNRVEGHIKLYVQGAKFLIQGDKDEVLKKLQIEGK